MRFQKVNPKNTAALAVLIALDIVLGGRGTAKLIRSALHGRARLQESKEISEAFLRNTLTKLKKGGLVASAGFGMWRLTKSGADIADFYRRKRVSYDEFINSKESKKRDTLIVFDIPEKKKGYRDLLRWELVALNFQKLQRSVWIGGSPLPHEFIELINRWELLLHIHVLKIRSAGTLADYFTQYSRTKL